MWRGTSFDGFRFHTCHAKAAAPAVGGSKGYLHVGLPFFCVRLMQKKN